MATPRRTGTLGGLWSRITGATLPRVKAMSEMGVSGTALYGGYIRSVEKSAKWTGQQKYITSGNIAVNVSIVAAGLHYFLNLIAHPEWSVKPAKDNDKEAEKMAEFVEYVIHNLYTPWSRVVRRAGMYRFHGFGIQEWIATKLDEGDWKGKIGFKDVEARPQFTIERWEVDDQGTILGCWQRSPQTGELLGLPRGKLIYLVDDTLSDSPEGVGLFRHIAEPYERLKRYLELEATAFERDLRGTPVGRAPLTLLNKLTDQGKLTTVERDSLISGLQAFTKMEVRQKDTGVLLDSQPYQAVNASGYTIASTPQWDVELLTGNAAGLSELADAVDRIQREIARIIGVEILMMGGSSSGGNRALAEDKSRNLYLNANAVLQNVAFAFERDLIDPLWTLNGFDDQLKPSFQPEDVAFKSVAEITSALAQMAQAGAVLNPNDEAVNDVRDLLGISRAEEMSPQMFGMLSGKPLGPDGKPLPPQAPVGPDGKPVKPNFPPGRGGPQGGPGTAGPQGAKTPKGTQTQKYSPDQPRDYHGRWTDGMTGEERFQALKAQWAQINNKLLQYLDNPDDPEVQKLMDQLKEIVKETNSLNIDPGTLGEGVGKPGGVRDVVIIGAGPGGLSAAINGASEGLDTLVVESQLQAGGQAKYSSRIENFPGFPIGVSGETLAGNMTEQAQRLGADLLLGENVVSISRDESTGLITVTMADGTTVVTRGVILAGGVQFRQLSFEGSAGPNVIYGDAKTLGIMAGSGPAVVIGGSNGAAQAALGVAQTASHVTVLSRSPISTGMSDYQIHALAASPKISVIEGDTISSLVRDSSGYPTAVTTNGGRTIPARALGIFAGSIPNTSYVPPPIRTSSGKIRVNANDVSTSIPGVYAVGDIKETGVGRIGVAVGDGQMAIRELYSYLSAAQRKVIFGKAVPNWNGLVDKLFALDRQYPFWGQTVEPPWVTPGLLKYSPKQPRDYHGRWTAGGGGAAVLAADQKLAWNEWRRAYTRTRAGAAQLKALARSEASARFKRFVNWLKTTPVRNHILGIAGSALHTATTSAAIHFLTGLAAGESMMLGTTVHAIIHHYAHEMGFETHNAVHLLHRVYDSLIAWSQQQKTLGKADDITSMLQAGKALLEKYYPEDVAKYSPDQPRYDRGDPRGGQWRPVHADVTGLQYYHGTTSDNVKAILNEGIKPRTETGAVGADRWAQLVDSHDPGVQSGEEPSLLQVARDMLPRMTLEERQRSVYIADNMNSAATYAQMLTGAVPGSEAAIFKVRIPYSSIGNLKEDELSHGYRFVGDIKPEWIQAYQLQTADPLWRRPWTLKIDAQDLYIVVVFMPPDVAKFDEDKHPRWPAGSPDSQGGEFRGPLTSGLAQSLGVSLSPDRLAPHRPLPPPPKKKNYSLGRWVRGAGILGAIKAAAWGFTAGVAMHLSIETLVDEALHLIGSHNAAATVIGWVTLEQIADKVGLTKERVQDFLVKTTRMLIGKRTEEVAKAAVKANKPDKILTALEDLLAQLEGLTNDNGNAAQPA